MDDHSHHSTKSLAIKLMTRNSTDLNKQCFLNVTTTEIKPQRNTLLLLHGYLGTSQDYHHFFHLFDTTYNIIAVDLRGHGKSDPCSNRGNTISWTISDFATDIYQIILQTVQLGNKVNIIASSLSTAIAIQLATNYPEIIETIFLISPTSRFKVPKWISIAFSIELFVPRKLILRSINAISWVLLMLARRQQDNTQRRRKIRGIRHFQKLQLSTHRKIFTQALKQWKADVSVIDQPVLIVAGIEDKIVPYTDSVKLFQLLENSALLTIHSKHQILISQIKLITDVLEQWLQDRNIILQHKMICADNLLSINDKSTIPGF